MHMDTIAADDALLGMFFGLASMANSKALPADEFVIPWRNHVNGKFLINDGAGKFQPVSEIVLFKLR